MNKIHTSLSYSMHFSGQITHNATGNLSDYMQLSLEPQYALYYSFHIYLMCKIGYPCGGFEIGCLVTPMVA